LSRNPVYQPAFEINQDIKNRGEDAKMRKQGEEVKKEVGDKFGPA